MAQTREISLVSRIYAGGFSGERVVEVVTSDGSTHRVLAPRDYCWTLDSQPLDPEQPKLGDSMAGLVAARLLAKARDGSLVVTTPDGDVFSVRPDIMRDRPPKSEIPPNVPVGS
ncbi:MAG TPA: hypothetical protein VFA26_00345 [Gemmataceae bacterium]|nr:hypothetical protein [Gemmataceae bacterium]